MENIDLVIVGAGPAGCATALHLLDADPSWADRMLILERAVHPRDKLCGGALSELALQELRSLGLQLPDFSFDIHKVGLVHGEQQFFSRGDGVLRIVRRKQFDHWLLSQVEKSATAIRQGEDLRSLQATTDHVDVISRTSAYRARMVVGADGSNSAVRRLLKWPDAGQVARLVEVLTPEDQSVEPHFRDRIATFDFSSASGGDLQGYYWEFPCIVEGRPMLNAGLFDSRLARHRPRADLKQLLRHELDRRHRRLDDYLLEGFPLRLWREKDRFSIPRVLLAGDAAGSDPLLGEGIPFALAYGRVAARCIESAFARDDFSLSRYRSSLLADQTIKGLRKRRMIAERLHRYPSRIAYRSLWRLMGLISRAPDSGRIRRKVAGAFSALDPRRRK